jgi:outer membrane immunogenic protein
MGMYGLVLAGAWRSAARRLTVDVWRRAVIAAPFVMSVGPTIAQTPAAVVTQSWAGFYVGGHAGLAWGPDAGAFVTRPVSAPTPVDPIALKGQSSTGGAGGAHAGYNFQLTPSWVVGVEGDISWMGLSEHSASQQLTSNGVPLAVGSQYVLQNQVNFIASARGRVGYAWDRAMVYGTGGLAWGDMSYGAYTRFAAVPNNNYGSTGGWSTGWVAGGGIEYATTRHIVVRAEYLYYALASAEAVTTVCSPFGCGATPPVIVYSWGDATIQVARIALSYKF